MNNSILISTNNKYPTNKKMQVDKHIRACQTASNYNLNYAFDNEL